MKRPISYRFFALSFIVYLLFAQAQSSPPARFYYLGRIGIYPAQLELSLDGEALRGHYFYESVGLPISLTQINKGANYFDFVLEPFHMKHLNTSIIRACKKLMLGISSG
jgi:hypothetical protein